MKAVGEKNDICSMPPPPYYIFIQCVPNQIEITKTINLNWVSMYSLFLTPKKNKLFKIL